MEAHFRQRLPGQKDDRRETVFLGALVFAAALVRIAYLLQYRERVPFLDVPISDSAYYHAWAERVAFGEGYGARPYYMAPLYPTLLGLLYRVTGPHPEVAVYLQSALGLVNGWLVARLGRRVAGAWAGLLGAVLMTLYAPLVFLETKVLTETLTITLLLLSVWCASRALDGSGDSREADPEDGVCRAPARGWLFACGVLAGLVCLARPNLLAMPGLVALWLAARALRHRPVPPLRRLAIAAAGLVLTIAPVTLRNAVVGDDIVLISSNGGMVFAQGNHPDATGISTVLPGFTPRIEEQQEQEMRIASQALGRDVRPSESSAFWFRKGIGFAWEDPVGWASLWLRKVVWSLHAREPRDVYNLDLESEVIPMLDLLFLPFPALMGLAVFGALRRPRPWPPVAVLMWIAVAAVGATLIVFSVSFRYRAPAVPLLAPFAGLGLLRLVEALRSRRFREAALGLACLGVVSLPSLVPYPIPAITAEAPANFGAAFLKRGQVGPALEWTRRALQMDPSLASANYNLGLALKRLGDRDGAIRAFEASLASRPDDPAVLNDLAVALDEAGRKEEAIVLYQKALALRPEGRIAYNLALALSDLKRFCEAVAALRTAESLGHVPDPAFSQWLQRQVQEGRGVPP